MSDALPEIDPTTLTTVQGGAVRAAGAPSTHSLLTELTSVLDSVKQVRSVGTQNGLDPTHVMMFMLLLQRQRHAVVAPPSWVVPPGY